MDAEGQHNAGFEELDKEEETQQSVIFHLWGDKLNYD